HLVYIHPSPLTTYMFFSFNHPSTSYIYTLSLHDALPIFFLCVIRLSFADGLHGPRHSRAFIESGNGIIEMRSALAGHTQQVVIRSEEHTSELQSLAYLVCRLLLEKKNNKPYSIVIHYNIS